MIMRLAADHTSGSILTHLTSPHIKLLRTGHRLMLCSLSGIAGGGCGPWGSRSRRETRGSGCQQAHHLGARQAGAVRLPGQGALKSDHCCGCCCKDANLMSACSASQCRLCCSDLLPIWHCFEKNLLSTSDIRLAAGLGGDRGRVEAACDHAAAVQCAARDPGVHAGRPAAGAVLVQRARRRQPHRH